MNPELEGAAASRGDPVENALRLASRYNDVKRFDAAEREARRGLAANPESADLQFELARSFLGRGQWSTASKATEQLLSLAPEWPPALNLMAILRTHQGRYGEAERVILEALRIAPTWPVLYETYGDLMQQTGHEAKAVRLYERSRTLDPEQADVHAKLALAESSRARGRLAEGHARAGLAHDPGEALAHAALATALLQRGRPFAARAHLREALRIEPDNEAYEEAWLESDRCCRVVYLPMYYWSCLLQRIPGKQFGVWGLVMLLAAVGNSLGIPGAAIGVLMLAYIGFCIYTWFAGLLLKVWLRIRPPQMQFEEGE